ncbi:MAG: glycosyl transferase family 2 [Sphingomonadales bacterium BRH_c3]|nr:MAG: glycosyl transferase family 2 [Sphingomonadales bacterium BRH_c3]
MSASSDVSVVIRTLNEAKWLPQLLDAIDRQETGGMAVEVVIVDSGSSDGTYEIGAKRNCKMVRIAKVDFTFGRSLNYGCEAANGRWLVFVSGHCIPASKRWLTDLIAPLRNGTCSYTYGRQIGREPITKFSEGQLFAKYFPQTSSVPQEGFFCNNANSALSKSLWSQHKFDEELTGLEDMELAKRIYQMGHKIGYVAEAAVEHIHEESWAQVRRRYEREALALRDIMPEVTLGKRDCLRYITAGVLLDAAAAVRDRRLHRTVMEIILFRTMQYVGTYKGNHLHRQISRETKERYFYPR